MPKFWASCRNQFTRPEKSQVNLAILSSGFPGGSIGLCECLSRFRSARRCQGECYYKLLARKGLKIFAGQRSLIGLRLSIRCSLGSSLGWSCFLSRKEVGKNQVGSRTSNS